MKSKTSKSEEKNFLELSILGELREELSKIAIPYAKFFEIEETNQNLPKNLKQLLLEEIE